MENIEEDLDQKNIERPGGPEEEIIESSPEPAPALPAKTKKVRSEAQKAAFERAKIKRAENIKKRKELKEQEKLEKKVAKTQITERIKEELHKDKGTEEVKAPRQTSQNSTAQRQQIVQNHYYYYGMPPPAPEGAREPPRGQKERKKKGKKVKRPPTPPTESSSEEEFSDVDEPDTYQDQYNTQPIDNYDIPPEPKIPKFKFGFV